MDNFLDYTMDECKKLYDQSVILCNNAERLRHEATAASELVIEKIKALELKTQQERHMFEDACDIMNEYVVFASEVTEGTAEQLNHTLRKYNRIWPNRPLVLELNTVGGDIVAGLSSFDTLTWFKNQGHQLTIRVRGEACSMGLILLQAADKREMGASAFLMGHRASFGIAGGADKVEDAVDQTRMLEARMYEILGERTAHPSSYWKTKLSKRKDAWFTAKQALAEGLVDAIA